MAHQSYVRLVQARVVRLRRANYLFERSTFDWNSIACSTATNMIAAMAPQATSDSRADSSTSGEQCGPRDESYDRVMGSEPPIAVHRDVWLRGLADAVVGKAHLAGARPAAELTGTGRVEDATAAILTGVACRHEGGELLDDIVEWLRTPGLLSDPDEAIDVALASVKMYRSCALPGDWWDALSLHVALLVHWGRELSLSQVEVEDLVANRFLLPKSAHDVAVMATVREPASLDDAVAGLSETATSFRRMIERVRDGVGETIGALLPLAAANSEVTSYARAAWYVATGRFLVSEPAGDEILSDDREEIRIAVSMLAAAVDEWLQVLTPLEVALARGIANGETVLREAIAVNARSHLLTAVTAEDGSGIGWGTSNGLSDQLEGETFVADWLVKEIISGGARSGLFEWGPTAYAWVALESHDFEVEFPLRGLGLGLPDNQSDVDFVVQLDAVDGPILMNYRAGHSLETLRWLAILILSERFMFDVFLIDEDGRLQLVQRMSVPAHDFASAIRNKTVAALSRHDLRRIELPTTDEHAVAGFFATENAKSELLLQLTRIDVHDSALQMARERLLDAEVRRSHAVNMARDPKPFETDVAAARRDYLAERRRYPRFGSRDARRDHEASILDFASDLTDDGRVLVHYNLYEGHVVAFWIAENATARGWIEGAAVDTGALVLAVQPWLEGSGGDVRALLAASQGLAAELNAVLVDVDAREVVISPWSVLHAVPWAALPLGGGTFGDMYRVSYAPSFEILRRLCNEARPERDGIALIGSQRGWLPWADAEIEAARASFGDSANVVAQDGRHDRLVQALSERRIVHIAAHGIWRANDHFASGVHLYDLESPDAFLTAAEVHRDADMRGAELVLLSTCDSGRGGTGQRRIEFYNGLDGAFLAQGTRAVVSTLWPVDDFASFLFMTNMHVRLRSGESVAAAFEDSVKLLRHGGYSAIRSNSDIGAALDAGDPRWTDKVAQIGIDFTDPYFWAPFRLSGAHWLSKPLKH